MLQKLLIRKRKFMNTELNTQWVFLILGLVTIFIVRNELKDLVNRIKVIDYKDQFKIILDQFKPKKEINKDKNEFFESIYEKISGAQIHFLILLKQFYSKGMKQGMPCGYASNYFQNLVKSQTGKYDGWITPFFTSYLEENNLVSVSDNFYRMEPLGFEFLKYLNKMGYSEKDKEF